MSAAAIATPTTAARPVKPWVRAPKPLNWLAGKGLTPIGKLIVETINRADQLGEGALSVSRMAEYLECSESTVYANLPAVEASGLVEAIRAPGKCTVYRMTFDYIGPKLAASSTPPKTGGVPLRKPEGSASAATGMDTGLSRTTRGREQHIETSKEKQQTAAAAETSEANVVVLLGHDVSLSEAQKLASTISAEDMVELMSGAEAYERSNEITNRGGFYASAVRYRWRWKRRKRYSIGVQPMPQSMPPSERPWTDEQLDLAANEQEARCAP